VKRILSVLALLAPLVAAMPATATVDNAGLARLQQLLTNLHTLRADFTQTVLDSDLTVNKESHGTLMIKRPGRFRWDYQAPTQQLIVGDGKRIWMYDKELEQVTVKPMDQTLASSPAMLLTGSGSLQDSFTVQTLGDKGSLFWVELTPRVQDSQFKAVRVGLGDKAVQVMELTDNLGQTTRIEFSHIHVNGPLDDKLFDFRPPPGTDVLGETTDAG
jgi:outer membrane lipoprotein carrier protein